MSCRSCLPARSTAGRSPVREQSSLSIGRGLTPFAALERSPLFEGVERPDVMSAALLMRPRSFATGDELLRAGEPGASLHVIVDGLVHAESEKMRRGDVVGAESLLGDEPHPVTVGA